MKRGLIIFLFFFWCVSANAQDKPEDIIGANPEIYPEPKEGLKEFYKYIKENLQYPEQARKDSIQGKVFVRFTVTKEGVLEDFSIARGLRSDCDEEAIRLLKNSSPWTPGTMNGVLVKMKMVVPIIFKF